MKAIAIGVFMALAFTAAARAYDNSANGMLRSCKEMIDLSTTNRPRNVFDLAYCMGLVEGLGFMLNAAIGTCKPNEVTTEQAMRVIARYIEARPQRMHEEFRKLAIEAMEAAWPCKADGK